MPDGQHDAQVIFEDGDGGPSGAEERRTLLHPRTAERVSFETAKAQQEEDVKLSFLSVAQELRAQSKLGLPLSLGLVASYLIISISLSFVGQLGTAELAAAALGNTLYGMGARLFLMGLCGALDTFASQAAGSGDYEALGAITQRATLFLLLHTIPIAVFFFGVPGLLRAVGQPQELARNVGRYLAALLPAVWVDAVYRPFNRTLVAQGIAHPQMWISGLVAAQHVGATYLCIYTFGWGFLGGAAATVWSNLLALLLLAGYVCAAGLQSRVWGTPSRAALQGWGAFARLAYASGAMKCLESWGFHVCTVVAGILPDPDSAVAAMGVALSCYGLLFMPFLAASIATSTRVGNALGAGQAAHAKLAALAAALSAPIIWVPVAIILVVPPSQRLLIWLFTNGEDELLLQRMRGLLYIVAVLEAFDGAQTVMSGVVSGTGKQAWGFLINAVSFWALALPAAFLLGFFFKLGVEGLYWGMTLGPITQCACYAALIWRLRWRQEAAAALRRVQEANGSL